MTESILWLAVCHLLDRSHSTIPVPQPGVQQHITNTDALAKAEMSEHESNVLSLS